jgi:hypothetical protein
MRLNLPLYVWMRPHGHRYTENPRVLGSYEGSLTGERVEYQTVPYVFYRNIQGVAYVQHHSYEKVRVIYITSRTTHI